MKLYSLLENIILEAASRSQIESAVEKKQRVRIYYDPTINRTEDEEDKNLAGYRNIETYVFGVSKAGNDIIRAYQLNGVTETDSPGWKTFRVDRITSWRPYPSFFYVPISDRVSTVPKYNSNGDKSMIRIYKQVKF
jgi:hypothetical protein